MNVFEKINKSMQKEPNNKYMEIIGHYVLDRCTDENDAAKVMDEKKTLEGAMSAIVAAASKKKRGSVAVLLPAEVFGEVDKYFGFKTDEHAQTAAMMGEQPAPAKAKSGKVIDLSDFFGG